ncbi:unnamed protein product [Mytilus coruscus]|uniref:Uncharacterized protein n=1 Tax=Mytilus coruscus TaxID=42192 RepID=A0A6J8BC83_MYTCO|nr:unnamed protein product [Mytilus coruscus]
MFVYIRDDNEPLELQSTKQRPTPRPCTSKQQKLPVIQATKEKSADDTALTIPEDSAGVYVLTVDSELSLAEDSDAITEKIEDDTVCLGTPRLRRPAGSASEEAGKISSEDDTTIDDDDGDVPQDCENHHRYKSDVLEGNEDHLLGFDPDSLRLVWLLLNRLASKSGDRKLNTSRLWSRRRYLKPLF